MNIISTNIGEPGTITWQGREVITGIYKQPVDQPIYLGGDDVTGDRVIDRKHHGGKDKACYLYSADHYPYWLERYPVPGWEWGLFGENLTVEGLDEGSVLIGNIYEAGEALIQVTQPRQPCYKLDVRFGHPEMTRDFISSGFPGVYVRVIREGFVRKTDALTLIDSPAQGPDLRTIFNMLYSNSFDRNVVMNALENPYLAESCRRDLMKRWNIPPAN